MKHCVIEIDDVITEAPEATCSNSLGLPGIENIKIPASEKETY
jgi:hypothetical protein